jgi:hypothetical protein
MSISEKLTAIAENEQKVYEAGIQKRSDDIERAISNNGSRTNYAYAFRMTNYTGYNFRLGLIRPVGSLGLLFSNYYGEQLPRGISCKNEEGTVLISSGFNETFRNSYNLKYIYDFGMPPAKGYSNTYYGCTSLETIEKVRVVESTIFLNSFYDCKSLRRIYFEGVIGQDIHLLWSKLLEYSVVKDIIYKLKDFSTNDPDNVFTRTIFFASEVLSMLQASSDDPNKDPMFYTLTQYEAMTPTEQAEFVDRFESRAIFDLWYEKAKNQRTNKQEATVGDNLLEYLDLIGWNY